MLKVDIAFLINDCFYHSRKLLEMKTVGNTVRVKNPPIRNSDVVILPNFAKG